MLVSQQVNTTVTYLGSDDRNNVRLLLPQAGIGTSAGYKAFGSVLPTPGTPATPFQYGGNVGYYAESPTAGVDDTEFYRTLHRIYRFHSGRFPQPDPTGINGGYNLYGYANNNPISWMDPDGTEPVRSQNKANHHANHNAPHHSSKKTASHAKHKINPAGITPQNIVALGNKGQYVCALWTPLAVCADGKDGRTLPGTLLQIATSKNHKSDTQGILATPGNASADTTPYLELLDTYDFGGTNYGLKLYDLGFVVYRRVDTKYVKAVVNGRIVTQMKSVITYGAAGAQFLDTGHTVGGEGSLMLQGLVGNKVGPKYDQGIPYGQAEVFGFAGSASKLHITKQLSAEQIDKLATALYMGMDNKQLGALGSAWVGSENYSSAAVKAYIKAHTKVPTKKRKGP
jgi:RHS repeat-associated protein